MGNDELFLYPKPKEIALKGAVLNLSCIEFIILNGLSVEYCDELSSGIQQLKQLLVELVGKEICVIKTGLSLFDGRSIRFCLKKDFDKDMYGITIDTEGITIEFGQPSGAFWAVVTLKQIVKQFSDLLPYMIIKDWPDFSERGIMIDISRCKIPTMETLYHFVDLLAGLKINQLQLYMEGVPFAYPSFEQMWRGNMPITGNEIMLLDQYCREHYIELVPCQNCFGHMEEWLAHEDFKKLAECPEGFVAQNGRPAAPATLNPLDPESLNLVDKMMEDLLSNFTSNMFNVCCDETFELGQGKSKEACDEVGTAIVYLDFVLKVNELVKKRGLTMMMWGDIILKYPDMISKVPNDIIVLEWGYERNHDFEGECEKFASSGIPFYVCPGTSSWISFAGRTDNAFANIKSAIINGKKFNAKGILITDWGDIGHLQPLPVSYAPICYGAALSWDICEDSKKKLHKYIDDFIFMDGSGITASLFMELGNYYKLIDENVFNGTNIARNMYYEIEYLKPVEGLKLSQLDDLEDYIDSLLEQLEHNCLQCSDAILIKYEFESVVHLIKHSVNLSRLKLFRSGQIEYSFEPDFVEKMLEDIDILIKELETVWLKRNRFSGLDKSLKPLRMLRKSYIEIISKKSSKL